MMLGLLSSCLRGRHLPPAFCAWVPRSFSFFSPPRGYGRARDEIPAAGGRILASEPGENIPRPRPVRHGAADESDLARLASLAPENLVYELPNATLRGDEGHVVTAAGRLVFDGGFWGRLRPRPDRDHTLYQVRKPLPRRRLPGLVVSLATDFALGGYGHFIHDALPRLRLLRLAGVNVAKADWIYFPRLETPATRALVASLGLAGPRLLNHDPAHDLECERLVATTYPNAVGSIAPREARFLSGLGSGWRPAGTVSRRRVFLSRSGCVRNFFNESEAHAVLRAHGFEIVDPASGPEALSACAQASVLAGIDGANMANVAFAPPDARVLLLYPESPPPLPYMVTLASSAGRPLHILAARPAGPSPQPYVAGFQVDLAALDHALEAVCSGLPLPPS